MKMTKEMRDNLVTVLYERCSKGEISVEQRELLIQKANSAFVAESTEKTVEEETPVVETQELTAKEKYDRIKTMVYEKCTNGEITVDQREELLEKARDRFLTITE